MTFEDIKYVLIHSVDFIEFQCNYNELIPEIIKAKQLDLEGWKVFMRGKNEMRDNFLHEYRKECLRDEYIMRMNVAKYVHDIDVREYQQWYLRFLKRKLKYIKLFCNG